MAFNVSGLSNYTNEQQSELLVKALFGGKTAQVLQAAGQVQPGIKSASKLALLGSTVYFQADGCGYNPSGTTTLSQRTLTVGAVKVEETLCPKSLEAKWMQTLIAPGSATALPFEEQIGMEKAAVIAETIGQTIWQGDTTSGDPNLNKFDGFVKIIAASSPTLGNSNPTAFTSVTVSNIDDILDQMYTALPARVASKEDLVCWVGVDTFKLMLINLKNANLFHYTPEAAVNMEMIYPGTNVKVIAVGGLSGTNKLVMGSLSNFFLGTDLMNEDENWSLWYSKDNDEVRFRASFKYGVQVAYPAEIVYFTL